MPASGAGWAEECFVFFGVHAVLWEFVEDGSVEESVRRCGRRAVRPRRESCFGQQGQELLEWPQGAQQPQARGCGQRPGVQQGHDVGVTEARRRRLWAMRRSCVCQSLSAGRSPVRSGRARSPRQAGPPCWRRSGRGSSGPGPVPARAAAWSGHQVLRSLRAPTPWTAPVHGSAAVCRRGTGRPGEPSSRGH